MDDPDRSRRPSWRPSRVETAPRRRLAKKRAPEPIEINRELQSAFDAVGRGKQIVFVTGGAGTGKSTFIRELRARFPEKPLIVLAPTGVAALNAGGQTIHSFCRLPLRPVRPDDVRKEPDTTLLEKLEMVVIDEISMVRADVLDGVDAFLRVNRASDRPFAGVQGPGAHAEARDGRSRPWSVRRWPGLCRAEPLPEHGRVVAEAAGPRFGGPLQRGCALVLRKDADARESAGSAES